MPLNPYNAVQRARVDAPARSVTADVTFAHRDVNIFVSTPARMPDILHDDHSLQTFVANHPNAPR
jgi:hypothetical protein